MRRAVFLLAALVVVLLLFGVSVFVVSYVISDMREYSGRERTIVERYPHYGGRHIATYPWTFSCSVRYTTRADRREVLGYYDEMLHRNGWEVLGFQTAAGRRFVAGKRLKDLWDLPASAGGVLVARQDGYSYWVSYEPPNREEPDLPDDKALVTVSANDHPPSARRFPV
jgi:hypothetical protein